MRACALEEIRAAMTKRGYYVESDHICTKKRKLLYSLVRVYKIPDPEKLTASVNYFIETRGAWYESREDAVMAAVVNYMHALYVYTK